MNTNKTSHHFIRERQFTQGKNKRQQIKISSQHYKTLMNTNKIRERQQKQTTKKNKQTKNPTNVTNK